MRNWEEDEETREGGKEDQERQPKADSSQMGGVQLHLKAT